MVHKAENHMNRIDFETIPWKSSIPNARAKTFAEGGRQLRLVEFSHDFVEPDWCTKGHIGYVLEGELELMFADQTTKFAQGDGVFIPPGDAGKHMVKVLTDTVRLILVEDV